MYNTTAVISPRLFYLIFFVVSFVVNSIWEYAHSGLYVWMPEMEETVGHLLWVSIKDAFFFTLFLLIVALLTQSWFWFEKRVVWHFVALVFIGFLFSVGIEYHAIVVGRWDYLPIMPIIPFLKVGVSPVLQMTGGLLMALLLAEKIGALIVSWWRGRYNVKYRD